MRFGVPSQEPIKVFSEGATLELDRKPFGPGSVSLSTKGGLRQLTLDTQAYVPQGIRFEADKELYKARFAAPFVDFLLWPFTNGKVAFKYELPNPSTSYVLAQLRPISDFVLLLYEASVQNDPVEFEIKLGSTTVCKGSMGTPSGISKQSADYAAVMAHAWTIAKHFDVHGSVEVKPIELLQQAARLKVMASVVVPTRPPAMILYWSEGIPADGKDICVPYVVDAIIGQYRMAIAVGIIGRPEPTGETKDEEGGELRRYRIETNNVVLCRQYICGRDDIPRFSFKALAQSVVDIYDRTTDILIVEGTNDYQ